MSSGCCKLKQLHATSDQWAQGSLAMSLWSVKWPSKLLRVAWDLVADRRDLVWRGSTNRGSTDWDVVRRGLINAKSGCQGSAMRGRDLVDEGQLAQGGPPPSDTRLTDGRRCWRLVATEARPVFLRSLPMLAPIACFPFLFLTLKLLCEIYTKIQSSTLYLFSPNAPAVKDVRVHISSKIPKHILKQCSNGPYSNKQNAIYRCLDEIRPTKWLYKRKSINLLQTPSSYFNMRFRMSSFIHGISTLEVLRLVRKCN